MRDKLVNSIRDEGLDGAIIFSNAVRSIARPSFLEVFAGYTPVANRNCVILSSGGAVELLVDLPRDVSRIARQTWIGDVGGAEEFDAELRRSLRDYDITASIGVVGFDRIDPSTYGVLDANVNTIQRMDGVADEMAYGNSARLESTYRELATIADEGFKAAYEHARPGIKEYELAAEVESVMRSHGAHENFNLFSSGDHNQLMHAPTDRIIREGDEVLCELSPMIDGRLLQLCRTIAVGAPDPVTMDKYRLLRRAMAKTKPKLQAGTPASVIAETMNGVFREEGYGKYCKPPYMRTRGHAFGVEPIGMSIHEGTETELEEGMVMVIHPNQYIPETGYLALGDPLLVTSDGVKTLTNVDPRVFTRDAIA